MGLYRVETGAIYGFFEVTGIGLQQDLLNQKNANLVDWKFNLCRGLWGLCVGASFLRKGLGYTVVAHTRRITEEYC